MKYFIAAFALLVALFIVYLLYATTAGNARVVEEIRTNPDGERAKIVMLLTFSDGKMIPVNYLREGNQVFVGADGPWWRAFRSGNVPVSMFIQGQDFSGKASVELEDHAYIDDIFSRLRPAAPEWLPDWANGKLVIIDLDAETSA